MFTETQVPWMYSLIQRVRAVPLYAALSNWQQSVETRNRPTVTSAGCKCRASRSPRSFPLQCCLGGRAAFSVSKI